MSKGLENGLVGWRGLRIAHSSCSSWAGQTLWPHTIGLPAIARKATRTMELEWQHTGCLILWPSLPGYSSTPSLSFRSGSAHQAQGFFAGIYAAFELGVFHQFEEL